MINKNIKTVNCYRVKVNCTNSSNNTFFVPKKKNESENWGPVDGDYLSCEDKICYVITDSAAKIYQEFGDKRVISVEKIGVGYTL